MTGIPPTPGWYPDPADPSRNLYWDGKAWHRNGAPPLGPPQQQVVQVRKRKRHPILWTLGILAVIGWISSQCSSSNTEEDNSRKPSTSGGTSAAPDKSEPATGKAPSVIKMVLSMAGSRYGISLEPNDVGRYILDDVNSERVPFDWANWRIVAQCENFVDGKLPVGVIKQDEFQRIADANLAGPDSLISTNGLRFAIDCPNDSTEQADSAAMTTPTETAAPTMEENAPDNRPAPTNEQVKQAFEAYITERADSGVMLAQAVESVTVTDGVVTVTLDAPPALLDLSPYDNLAELFGTPAAFNDDDGIWLRETVNRVDVVNADGTALGSLTAAELNQKAVS